MTLLPQLVSDSLQSGGQAESDCSAAVCLKHMECIDEVVEQRLLHPTAIGSQRHTKKLCHCDNNIKGQLLVLPALNFLIPLSLYMPVLAAPT